MRPASGKQHVAPDASRPEGGLADADRSNWQFVRVGKSGAASTIITIASRTHRQNNFANFVQWGRHKTFIFEGATMLKRSRIDRFDVAQGCEGEILQTNDATRCQEFVTGAVDEPNRTMSCLLHQHRRSCPLTTIAM
jgi:hypothetical protein